jgi:hypothetical protein
MSLIDRFGSIHPSALRQGSGLLRWVQVTPRAHGALRYRCPVSGSFVLVTDDDTLKELAAPRARVRCVDCGEVHLLTQDSDAEDPAEVVDGPAKS